MATGGVFTLVQNDGQQDKILMATKMLQNRLKEIRKLRCRNPSIRDQTPTLVDIEKTHILFMNAHFKPFAAIAYEYNRVAPQEGRAKFGATVSFSILQFGDFFNDMAIHVVLTGLTAQVAGDQVFYCDFPGHKMLRGVHFEVNHNILDEYDSDLYNFHYNFYVPENKRISWLRNVGQEVPTLATLTQNPGVDPYRERKFILNGAQTPQPAIPVLEMWIPLLFWFNVDPRLMIPSVAIPYGQRFITVDIAPLHQMCFGVNNGGGGTIIPPTISVFELYTNNIFVNPDIHDIFIKRLGFSLIRMHRYQDVTLSSSQDDILLDNLRWPTETLYWGARPSSHFGSPDKWYKFHIANDYYIPYPVAVPNAFPPPTDQLAFADAHYQSEIPIFQNVAFRVQAVDLYTFTPVSFFNSYVPYTYGGQNIVSPVDVGMYMTTFNLYPGAYQPSGHINLSNVREFYLRYMAPLIGPGLPCTLTIYAVTINFLLISSGSLVRRFNT
jgi:hypothetical protein